MAIYMYIGVLYILCHHFLNFTIASIPNVFFWIIVIDRMMCTCNYVWLFYVYLYCHFVVKERERGGVFLTMSYEIPSMNRVTHIMYRVLVHLPTAFSWRVSRLLLVLVDCFLIHIKRRESNQTQTVIGFGYFHVVWCIRHNHPARAYIMHWRMAGTSTVRTKLYNGCGIWVRAWASSRSKRGSLASP